MSTLQMMSNTIDHTGIIKQIKGSQLFIEIVQQSACADCHAKGMCSASDSKAKIIEITDLSNNTHQVGDSVIICGKTSTGLLAVLFAFVLPICVLVGSIIIGNTLQWDDGLSAIAGIFTLIPYYFVLYLFREKMKHKFTFTIKR
jgi:sigma-E factor negative regulatory protein RseC